MGIARVRDDEETVDAVHYERFLVDANANQKLCIALESTDRTPLHPRGWRRIERGPANEPCCIFSLGAVDTHA